ncbi:hypothetical protein [Aquimarina algicola]|uniref:SH3 domain-containing protein n=1 Tax=Aquimarina algicola TaxID=2589995 RepID=A0A504JDQ6_9FLAO|nr:hypothetical protein [Aquimarina algicola]TPN84521.1 hypothetical protein FHK87_16445 [Aquimarina algicola]
MKKNKVLIFLCFTLLFFSCKKNQEQSRNQVESNSTIKLVSENIPKVMDTTKKKIFDPKNESLKDIETSLIPVAEKFLKQCDDFKPLPYPEFRKQIQKIYGIDIDEYSSTIFPMSYRFIPDIILKEQRIVIDEMMIEDNTPSYFCDYNNLIFYEDQKIIHKFKTKRKEDLRHLVQRYGYSGNKTILSSAFSQIDFYSKPDLDELLFDVVKIDGEKEVKSSLRKELFKKVYEYTDGDFPIETYMEDMILNPKSYVEADKTLAFIMNTGIDRELPKWGLPEYIYDLFPEYLEKMEKANYYGFETLREYSKISYGNKPKDDKHPKPVYSKALINDPDGYTNVRNIKGEILFKIQDGEEFMVSKDGKNRIGDSYKKDWWFVAFKGKNGWIHKSRVEIINE